MTHRTTSVKAAFRTLLQPALLKSSLFKGGSQHIKNQKTTIKTTATTQLTRLASLTLLPAALFATSAFASESSNYMGNTDPAKLIYGSAIYDYYLNDHISAANILLTQYDEENDIKPSYHTDILLGQIYSDLQLIEPAKNRFNNVIKHDIIKKTRYETWYHLAELAFQEADYKTTFTILTEKINSGNKTEFEDRRKILLANTYLAQNRLSDAEDVSKSLSPDSHAAAYARYNIGTTLITGGKKDEGIALLEKIITLPPVTSEVKALRERAALAIGFTHIKHEECGKASAVLSQVPLNSIYKNDSLLGLGFCLILKDEHKSALVPLHELIQGPAISPSVHEGLLLTARAYEELKATRRALFGYRYTIDILDHERLKLEEAIAMTKTNAWLKPLQDASGLGNEFALIDESSFNDYYYLLFNSQEFNQALVNYSVLQNYQDLLQRWLKKLPVIQRTVAAHQSKLSIILPSVNPRLLEAQEGVEFVERRYNSIKDLNTHIVEKREQHANKAVVQMRKVQKISQKIEDLPLELQPTYNDRLDKIKGVLLYNIYTRKRGSIRAIEDKENTEEFDTLMADLQERFNAIQALSKTSNRLLNVSPDAEFSRIEQELNTLLEQSKEYAQEQEAAMKTIAVDLLFVAYQQIKSQLGKAHHSLGRLQGEESLSKKKAQREQVSETKSSRDSVSEPDSESKEVE